MTIYRVGSRGEEIKRIQEALATNTTFGRLAIDGIFGRYTSEAVKQFQKDNWLVVDGIVGPCTLAALLGTEAYHILHPITLVPQGTSTTCWLATIQMLSRKSIPLSDIPDDLLGSDGGLLNDSESLQPRHTQRIADLFNFRLFYPQSYDPMGLANILSTGPVASHILWDMDGYLSGAGSSGHFVIIAGIRGDGTAEGTTVRIYDPWPVNIGNIRSVNYARLLKETPGQTYQLMQRW